MLPLVGIYFLIRVLKDKAYAKGFWQRLSIINGRLPDKIIHIHCASMGEVKTVAPLVNLLLERHPQFSLVITNTTAAGRMETERQFAGKVYQMMAPLDLFFVIKRFCSKVKPQLSIFVEVEIWPQWLRIYKQFNIPLLLINGRMSEKSFQQYMRLSTLFRPAFSAYDWVGAQTDENKQRFETLGAQSVTTTGNLKFALTLPDNIDKTASKIKIQHDLKRPLWIAASVHEGEYQQIIAAHIKLLEQFPKTLLIIVPRYKERFNDVENELQKAKLAYITRSSHETVKPGDQVWLIDSIGELIYFYALADIAYVGGSLVNKGGHNPLEAAALSIPIMMGPYTQNCQFPVDLLKQPGALIQIENSKQISKHLAYWFTNHTKRKQAGKNAKQIINSQSYILEYYFDKIIQKINQLNS